MGLVIVTKKIGGKGKLFNERAFYSELRYTMLDSEQAVLKDFEAVTATWEHEVVFDTLEELGSDLAVAVGTDDAIFRYIDEGTRVRYATMSADFSPKTRPRVLRSYPGRGEMLFVNTNNPKPGIQAREFTKTIEKKHQRSFERKIERALDRALKRSGL